MKRDPKSTVRSAIASLLSRQQRSLVLRFLTVHCPWLRLGGASSLLSNDDVFERLESAVAVPRCALLPFRVLRDLVEPEGFLAFREALEVAGARRLARAEPLRAALLGSLVVPGVAWAARERAQIPLSESIDFKARRRARFSGDLAVSARRLAVAIARDAGRVVETCGFETFGRCTSFRFAIGPLGVIQLDELTFDVGTGRLTVNAPSARHEFYRRRFGEMFFGDVCRFGPWPRVDLTPLVLQTRFTLSAEGVAGVRGVRIIAVHVARRNHPYTNEEPVRSGDIVGAMQDAVSRGRQVSRVDLEFTLADGRTTTVSLGENLFTVDEELEPVLEPFLVRSGLVDPRGGAVARSGALRAFFERLVGVSELPEGTREDVEADFGTGAFEFLARNRVQIPSGIARNCLCPRRRTRCHRRIVSSHDPRYPYEGVPHGERCCDPKELTRDEVTLWTTSEWATDEMLRTEFQIERLGAEEHQFDRARLLGVTMAPERRDAFIVYDLNRAAGFLARRHAMGTPTLALATRRPVRMSRGARTLLEEPGSVGVVFLAEALEVRDGKLVNVLPERPPSSGVYERVVAPYCLVHEAGHWSTVGDREAYESMMARVPERADAMIDFTRKAGQKYRAGKKDRDGVFREFSIQRGPALVYAEYALRRVALFPRELKSVSGGDPHALMKRGRQHMDVNLGARNKWLATRYDEGRFHFDPPPGYVSLIVVPFGFQLLGELTPRVAA